MFAGEAFLWGETLGLKLPGKELCLVYTELKLMQLLPQLWFVTVLRLSCCNMCEAEVF